MRLESFIKQKKVHMLLAGIVLFMQCFLLQHQFDHHAGHDTHETVQECQFCLGAQQINYALSPIVLSLLLGLTWVVVLFFYSFSTFISPLFFLPQSRAPPVY